ncbi:MAG: hypothetical protein KAX18_09460 [Candidatus Lokiarchaeota archaeon]|nr:hypothetical protein [Candidatus Lokiarchaeota archaeon]
MVNIKEDGWFYALIAAILGIISVFTPVATQEVLGITISTWLGGVIQYWSGTGADIWVGIVGSQVYYLGLTLICVTLLLVYSINSWRGKEFKWDWLIYILTGLGMFIFSILFWTQLPSGTNIGFASIGIFIASIVAILAFVIDKFGDKIFGQGE